MSESRRDLLRRLVAAVPPTRLAPRELFIAWHGVATLAYRGWSPPLLGLRREIEAALPALAPENPGARWPKTTLGALRDGRILSLEEARVLRRICDELRPAVETEAPLEIQALSWIGYATRSLEERQWIETLDLRGAPAPLRHEPPADHLREVEEVMGEFAAGRLEEYLPYLQKPGNRETHYRETATGETLMFDLGVRQPAVLDRFLSAVDRALPGAYRWFDPASRHVTVRGLD